MPKTTLRLLRALFFFVWAGFVVAAFYVVQKPQLMGAARGLGETLWTVTIWLLLVFNAWGSGCFLLQRVLRLRTSAAENLFLGTGIGLGLQGLLGYAVGLMGGGHPAILLALQIGMLVLILNPCGAAALRADWTRFTAQWRRGKVSAPRWAPAAAEISLALTFVLALAPPAEGFDVLFYHLPLPLRVLNGEGLQPVGVPHFWFPALPEGAFLWALGLGAERASQLLHLTWGVAAVLLLWHWAGSVWNGDVGNQTLVVLLTMPSLYLLGSWAYTDLALTFFGLATIYAAWHAAQNMSARLSLRWVALAGIAAGMSMGVKYTSFPIPLTGGLLLLWWGRKSIKTSILTTAIFSGTALLVASPWYLRNWWVMGNPFYPFVFGGLYWDKFLAARYANAGTGIGWNLRELLLLPFNATLGHRDINFYDGRIGPLFLLFAPPTAYTLFSTGKSSSAHRALVAIGLLATLSGLAWVVGVVKSAALWQTRLLFPALIPFALPTALGWKAIKKLDIPNLRISFVVNFLVAGVLVITLADMTLYVIRRNPLAYAVGLETRAAYLEKTVPSYAQAIDLVAQIPEDASIYAIFEPRSYYLPRKIQIDPILANFGHDLHLYRSPEAVVQSWRDSGYTHVLLYRRGADFLVENAPDLFPLDQRTALEEILYNALDLVGATTDGVYVLYRIR